MEIGDLRMSPVGHLLPADDGTIHRTPAKPAAMYGDLRRQGLRPTEAGNLTAYAVGLPPVESGWLPRELEHLLFLRHLSEAGIF
jgi:hypothetical protein